MAQLARYPDLFTHRKQSVLPKYAQHAIYALGRVEGSGVGAVDEIEAFRTALEMLDPKLIAPAGIQIRDIGGINYSWDHAGEDPSDFSEAGLRAPTDYGWFLQFHGDGFKREAALKRLDGPPRSPFEFVSIVYRMNDWVAQVRAAALEYGAQYFPRMDHDVAGRAAFFLLLRMQMFARWDDRAFKCVEDTFYRRDVLAFIKQQLRDKADGPVTAVLRRVMQRPDLDECLPELAAQAKSAAVRSCATDFLLNGRAQWANGYKRVWVDKVHGVSRLMPDLQQRPLSISVDVAGCMDRASRDRSAKVRKIAASALIARLGNRADWHDAIAERLKSDPNQGVASRMEFYFRKLASGGA